MKKILKFLFDKIVIYVLEPLIVSLFHIIYYHSKNTWLKNRFLGFEILQCPFDLQNYQELLFRVKPKYIIQTGIAGGGSLLFLAKMLDIIDSPPDAIVIGVDILLTEEAKKLKHPRINIIEGSSISHEVVDQIKMLIKNQKGFVILDSDHSKKHVLAEINIYKDFVEKESYLVVEDTNVNGHPVSPFFGPGPMEAVNEFLFNNKSFIQDNQFWKRNKISFHKYGWLKRV